MAQYDEEQRGIPLFDHNDRQECDIAGEDAIMSCDSDSNISNTVDSEDENVVARTPTGKLSR
jgi:hypothetical protein